MTNPIEDNLLEVQPPPTGEPRKRIEFLAKALAYGATHDLWSPRFTVTAWHKSEATDAKSVGGKTELIGEKWRSLGHPNYARRLDDYLRDCWKYSQPQAAFLESFGYLAYEGENEVGSNVYTLYLLTPKALALLESPALPPHVFISYKRDESSVFGLLIAARLQVKGIQNPFIDMNLAPGDELHAELEKVIRQSQYFICLVGRDTLNSPHVLKEIQWAQDTPGITLIPIWHNQFNGEGEYPASLTDFIRGKNAIRVKEESAEEYNAAVIKLLNRMGYAP